MTAYELGVKSAEGAVSTGLKGLRDNTWRPGQTIGQGLRRIRDTVMSPDHKVQRGVNKGRPTYVTSAQQKADGAGTRNQAVGTTR